MKNKNAPKDVKNKQSHTNTALPEAIEDRVNLALEENLCPAQKRLLAYLADHPNTFTHILSFECAVLYPPARFHEMNSNILPKCGLKAVCHKPKKWLKNRYGDQSRVHQWRLVKIEACKEVA